MTHQMYLKGLPEDSLLGWVSESIMGEVVDN